MSLYMGVQYDDSSGSKVVLSEFFTNDLEQIIRDLDAGASIDYYNMNYSGPQQILNLQPISLNATRNPGPATEIVQADADGQSLGTAVVEA